MKDLNLLLILKILYQTHVKLNNTDITIKTADMSDIALSTVFIFTCCNNTGILNTFVLKQNHVI